MTGKTPSDGTNLARFGDSISMYENTAVIGADSQTGGGKAYVFMSFDKGTTWGETQKFVPSSFVNGDGFGSAVSLYRSTLLVGAHFVDSTAGAAYIYLRACGNGKITGSEQCDDGNVLNGDGCSPLCDDEPGWFCFGEPSVCKKGVPGGSGSSSTTVVAVDGNTVAVPCNCS